MSPKIINCDFSTIFAIHSPYDSLGEEKSYYLGIPAVHSYLILSFPVIAQVSVETTVTGFIYLNWYSTQMAFEMSFQYSKRDEKLRLEVGPPFDYR